MKIFVGGLPHDITLEEFKGFFESFGTITDAVIIRNKDTKKSRGFGFITFDSEEVVEKILQNRFYDLKNKRVEVKRAKPKEPKNNNVSTETSQNLGHNEGLCTYVTPFSSTHLYPQYHGAWFGGCMDYYLPQYPFYAYSFGHPGGYYGYYYYQHTRFGQNTKKVVPAGCREDQSIN